MDDAARRVLMPEKETINMQNSGSRLSGDLAQELYDEVA